MITNALNELLKPVGYLKGWGIHRNYDRLVDTLMGGMVLFDSNIEEDVDTVLPPAAPAVVGYAADDYVNDTTDIALGSANLTETEQNDYSRYRKFVYDFTTSQANGKINCIALTHINNAQYAGLGSSTNLQDVDTARILMTNYGSCLSPFSFSAYYRLDGFATGANERVFLLDADEDTAYYFCIINGTTLRIVRRYANVKSAPVVVQHKSDKALIEQKDITISSISTSYGSWNYDHDDGCLYIVTSSEATKANGTGMSVVKVSIPDLTVTQYTLTNNTGTTLYTQGDRWAFVHQGYVYIRSNSSTTKIYKIKLEDPTEYAAISGALKTSSQRPIFGLNGRIYYEYGARYSGEGYLSIVNGSRNVIETPSANQLISRSYSYYTKDFVPIKGHPLTWLMVHYSSSGVGSQSSYNYEAIAICTYLATINNLSRTIEKTSDKTMKITYTIQEV